MADAPMPGNLKTVYAYHDRTKHQLDRYARSLGYMDWDNQPNPFRRFDGATRFDLEIPEENDEPTYDSLYGPPREPQPLNAATLSRLFFFSMALSAWKEVTFPDGSVRSRWSLRVDPSSGNLHPTEGYLICGPVEGLAEKPAVYHYAPFDHSLELRRELDGLPGVREGSALLGISSIHWREAWKYGERAFRYCQHDCGHVIGALALSAASLGWSVRLLESASSEQVARLIGTGSQRGPEAEHADCLLAVTPASERFDLAADEWAASGGDWLGTPNDLSKSHQPWSVIEDVAEASVSFGFPDREAQAFAETPAAAKRDLSADRIIRQRRSAMAMDGKTSISRELFFGMLRRAMPRRVPYATLPWMPAVSLALFAHRVEGLASGLYVLVRHPSHEPGLRAKLRSHFEWSRPEACPDDLPLFLMVAGDAKDAARTLSCQQEIAADGAFSLGMLARFDDALRDGGPAMYPRLFWETGVIGQVLYLEAEAAGIRATGIGCFFDDLVHSTLGIEDHSWQSLYHFTVGAAVDDPRLQTVGAYEHLEVRRLRGADARREA